MSRGDARVSMNESSCLVVVEADNALPLHLISSVHCWRQLIDLLFRPDTDNKREPSVVKESVHRIVQFCRFDKIAKSKRETAWLERTLKVFTKTEASGIRQPNALR